MGCANGKVEDCQSPNQSFESDPKKEENSAKQDYNNIVLVKNAKNAKHADSPATALQEAVGHLLRHCAETARWLTYEESPPKPLPPAEYGDRKLGLTSYDIIKCFLAHKTPAQFCDPDFPADANAITYSGKPTDDIVWLRPRELVPPGVVPHMLVDGFCRDDINQGNLGDCWFLSACAAVSGEEKFMRQIVSNDFALRGMSYCGLLKFRFWRFGDWVDVYVDDRLPTRNGELIYAKCTDPGEFWVPLLEKAYAKLHGSYEAIEGGQAKDALVDLTGGIAERIEPTPENFPLLMTAHKAGSFIACSRRAETKHGLTLGLVGGHAYTVTGVAKVKLSSNKGEEQQIVRIRNPWVVKLEWTGEWSDRDSCWDLLDEKTKVRLQLRWAADGEFWMSYHDFSQHFEEFTVCTVGPDFDGDGVVDRIGHMDTIRGEWIAGVNAGGSRNSLRMFVNNPQYLITIERPDSYDPVVDDENAQGKCSFVVQLLQEHRRSQRHLGVKVLQINIMLFRVRDGYTLPLPLQYFAYNREVGSSGLYTNYRDVSARFQVPTGQYVLVPSSFEAGREGAFLIRVFAEHKFALEKLPPTKNFEIS